jgi:precorrin-2 dehydrogenase/sirohydrochlorin ferrochelatase
MPYYPVFLRVADRSCVVVGGGAVATRKVASLLEAGARVTVISPRLTDELAAHAATGLIAHHSRRYQRGDLHGCFLAYAATDDDDVHEQVACDADAAGVLLNVVDKPQWCTFIVPATLRRGDLQIAVSTGGGSPALAGHIRDAIDASLGDEYDQALTVLSRLRVRLHETGMTAEQRQRAFKELINSDLLENLRSGDAAGVDRVLARCAGHDTTLASLGVMLRSDVQGGD